MKMASGNRKSGIHTAKVIDVVNNHRFAPTQRSDKWQLRMEEAFKKSEEKYRNLLNNIKLGILRSTPAGRILEVNPAMEEITGYSRQELLKMDISKIYVHPEEREAIIKELVSTRGKVVRELRWWKKDGTEMVVLAIVVAVRDDTGKILHFDAIIEDVTERKRAEEELGKAYDELEMRVEKRTTELIKANKKLRNEITERERAEEQLIRLSNAVKMSTDSIVISDLEAKIIDVNEASLKMYGADDKRELIGKNSLELIAPEEREKAFESMREVPKKGYAKEQEHHAITKDGSKILVETSTAILKDADGKPIGFVAISRDITERKRVEEALKESEEQSRSIVENSHDGIMILDDAYRFTYVNDEVCRISGYSREEIIGQDFRKFLDKESKQLVANRYIRRQRGEEVPHRYEFNFVHKDGQKRRVEISSSVIKDSAGKVKTVAQILDITERKLMEEALRESGRKYSTLVEQSNDGIAIIQDGLIRFVNPKMLKIYGLTAGETLDKPFLDFVSPEYRDLVVDRYKRRMSGEEVPNIYELEILAKDGSKIPLEINASRIEYQGSPANMVIVRDITERKRMEEALKESEGKYRSLVNDISLGIFRSTPGPRGRFLEVNLAMERITGYSREELLQIDVCDLYQHPEERQQCLEEIASAAGMTTRETRFRKKDGTEIVVSDTKVAIRDDAGQIIYFDGILEDITERKKSEEQIKRAAEEWRTTFDSITDWVSIVDKDFKLVRVNKAFADAFGKKPGELIGKTCYQVVHKTNEPVRDCPRRKTLRTKRPAAVEFFEPSLEMYLEARTSPIFNEKDEVVACIEVTTDVTERKRMQEQLMLTHRLASLGELVSGVAHELNNPLTSVIGFSQLLMEGEIADDIREDLSLVYSEAQRAAGIVENLLTFARKHAPAKQLTRINNVIEDVLKLRAYWQRVNNIEVRRQFASDLPEIMVDFVQMQQVFLNIIINAEYFMIQAHNRGTLTTTTKKVGDVVRISFADDGPGIAKENLTRIFDPFFTTKEVGVGTGLGLSICHGIVTAHGGRIYARSQVGEGATFVVELPINSP
jgi:PAS domain S-box-containing protein